MLQILNLKSRLKVFEKIVRLSQHASSNEANPHTPPTAHLSIVDTDLL